MQLNLKPASPRVKDYYNALNQVSTDNRSDITNDPNRPDDPEYILRPIGQVITVSLETVNIVNVLPGLGLPDTSKFKAAGVVQ